MILTLDAETHEITPSDPWPEPVGVAVQIDTLAPQYRCWGHPSGNNTTKRAALGWLHSLVHSAEKVVMFNAGFDRGVLERRLGISIPWHKVEDVQVLAFLAEPYADKLDLKSVAHRQIGMPPDEETQLHAWIKKHVPQAKGKRAKLGRYIAFAPGDMVSPYGKGDTTRTGRLYRMWGALRRTRAYQREVELLPVLDAMTNEGVPLDHAGIERDLPTWLRGLALASTALQRILGSDIDLGKHEEVCDRLEKLGLVTEWIMTKPSKTHPEGRRSLAYESLVVLAVEGKFDRRFAEIWGYYSTLSHVVVTFAEPWLEAGDALHPVWNGTRQERGGARTGRLSSNPNVMNIIRDPTLFDVPKSWPAIPRMRHYVLAPRGQRLVGGDVSQQELRVLADAVGEPLRGWYRKDPNLDLHMKVSQLILEITGLHYERGPVKIVNFSKIYGAGVPHLASQLKSSEADARLFKAAHTQALPGIAKWERKLRARNKFETAGGREYCHDPERPYKSPNTYIQGSSADQSKEIMIAIQPELVALEGSLSSMSHDEFVSRVPARNAPKARDIILDAIISTGQGGSREMFAVPMRGEGYVRQRWQE